MSDASAFRTPAEEAALIREELGQLRDLLREIAARLTQIERHTKRAFGGGPTVASEARKPRSRSRPESPPTLDSKQAAGLFDELVMLQRSSGRGVVTRRLDSLELPDLRFLASELGLPLGNNPSRKSLTPAVLGRV